MDAQNRRTSRTAADGAARPVRRRPRDRRAQIAAVSVEAFGALGYHGVSMEEIASRLDISSTALYRHYPSKYALFREEALRLSALAEQMVLVPAALTDAPAERRLAHVLDTMVRESIANRSGAAMLRWQSRYLEPEDRQILVDQLVRIHGVLGGLLVATRPGLGGAERTVLAAALLSVTGSISDHHVSIPVRALTALLHAAVRAVAGSELPPLTGETEVVRAEEIPRAFKHELLLERAIALFHERGYPNVSVEDIATAAGLPASSAVYRYYRGKGDILAAAFRRAADRVSAVIGPTIAAADGPEQALSTLIDLYVAGSFAERELTFVYYAEIGNVPAEDRTVLRNIQRLNVEEWAKLAAGARPELSPAEARVLVHAALALVVDLAQWLGPDNPICGRDRVAHLMRVILSGCG
ncbi:TetR/AcrR family transcriptional regulator [Nocardia puris]|uniref:TetR family transcriptional regulator n=1 Tax=Nocardia puris TaxID=208602 RepID=A0A366DLC4_9NOCA|nr:TetR/AcrR family transcriptional regulator [Nocardia puris]MBF6211521.1 TetR/AcrR family transcriptional regulator [Nocardia puris]RBO90882.1 TetR family transcriptional regulator [Nocardia puris]